MKALRIAVLCTLTTFLFSGCKKDKDDVAKKENCRITKSYLYDGGVIEDSAVYFYSGNSITKIESSEFFYTLDYDGNNNITKRSYYNPGTTTAALYDQISYNSNNTISKIETFEKTVGTTFQSILRYDFAYINGKFNKITVNVLSNNITTKVAEYMYTYTGDNITGVLIKNFTGSGPAQETLNFTFDTNPNYFKKQGRQVFLTDLLFAYDLFEPSALPLTESANNVATLPADAGSTEAVSYVPNEKQNLKELKVNNKLITSYAYQCQ